MRDPDPLACEFGGGTRDAVRRVRLVRSGRRRVGLDEVRRQRLSLSAGGWAEAHPPFPGLDEPAYVQVTSGLQWAKIPAGFVLQTQTCRVYQPTAGTRITIS